MRSLHRHTVRQHADHRRPATCHRARVVYRHAPSHQERNGNRRRRGKAFGGYGIGELSRSLVMVNRKLQYAILISDLLWISAALLCTAFLCSGAGIFSAGSTTQPVPMPAIAVAILVWIPLYFSKRLEGFCRGWHLPSIIAQVTVGACCLLGALLVLAVC